MASDDKNSTAKAEKDKAVPKDKAPAEAPAKAETKADDAPSNYSRGEGQKPVSQAYKDNWNAIYAKKKKR